MTWVAVAIGGSALLGAYSSNKAAGAQRDAANQASALQQQQYEQTRADQAPFRQGGLEAQNRLMTLLGIGGRAPSTGSGGSVAGMIGNAVADSGLANGGINVDPNSPDYGKYARDFGMSDFQADPGYAFRLSEGQKALDRSAAARGGMISGAALKAAGRYGQDMASQEFTNAFNRYQTNRSNQLNPLQSLMGAGQSATNFVGSAGQNYATNAGNAYGAAGQAAASGYMGQANAVGQGVSQYLGYQSNNNLLNALQNRGSTYGGGYSPSMGTQMSQQDYAIASGGF
jgi:hypothetical protein